MPTPPNQQPQIDLSGEAKSDLWEHKQDKRQSSSQTYIFLRLRLTWPATLTAWRLDTSPKVALSRCLIKHIKRGKEDMSWFLRVEKDTLEPQRQQLKQKRTNRSINNTSLEALRVPFLKGGVRARHAIGGGGGGCRRRGGRLGLGTMTGVLRRPPKY